PGAGLKGSKDEFLSQPPGRRALIVGAGPLGNYLLGLILFYVLFVSGLPTLGTTIGGFIDDYPAKESGLQIKDKIISVDGQKVNSWEELTSVVHPRPNEELRVQVERNSDILEFNLMTKDKKIIDLSGKETTVGLLGISPDNSDLFIKKISPFAAVKESTQTVYEISKRTLLAILNILLGRLSLKDSVSGPVGIIYFSTQVARKGLNHLLFLAALINISIAIFNLLPIPVLDGGHLMFIAVERIRRKPLPLKVQENFAKAGMVFFLALFLYLTYFDIWKVFFK
ncbi:MAG TPA: RIP metalloprotease RseP, partial [Candidatus Omnitrophica bacterium]|nr:RIP metalloprotease RseP [Candidatus Omnitrophota bacterium]